MSGAYHYAGLGLQFAATLGLFGYGGSLLDGRLGTEPLFLVLGIFLGFGLGTYSLVLRFRIFDKRSSTPPPTHTGEHSAASDDSDPERHA